MTVRDSLLIAKFNPKNYIFEICWALITFVYATPLIYIIKLLPFQPWIKEIYLPLPISWIKVIVWLSLYFITRPLGRYLYKVALYQVNYYKFDISHWPKKWRFHGGVLVQEPDRLLIRRTRAGCLLNTFQWKNFKMNFSMQFLRDYSSDTNQYGVTRSFGMIFRAQDLENYLMLEVWAQDNGDIFAKPHVRLFGNWEDVDDVRVGTFSLNTFHNLELNVVGDRIAFSIDGGNPYIWIIPTHVHPNQLESLPQDNGTAGIGNIPEIPFRITHGMIGFRAHPGQGAVIQGLEIRNA